MYSVIYSLCILLLFISDCVEAAPSIPEHVSQVSKIIDDCCMEQSNSHAFCCFPTLSQPSNDSDQENSLEKYLNEMSSLSQDIQKNNSDFDSVRRYLRYVSPLKKGMLITPVRHCNLSVEQNTQFYIMTQLAIFANYFRSQERDNTYPEDVENGAIQIKNNMYRAICKLKNFLLQSYVTLDDIDRYVKEDYTHRWVSLDMEYIYKRRAFVLAELNILSQFLESFYYKTNFVAMENNFPKSNCV